MPNPDNDDEKAAQPKTKILSLKLKMAITKTKNVKIPSKCVIDYEKIIPSIFSHAQTNKPKIIRNKKL